MCSRCWCTAAGTRSRAVTAHVNVLLRRRPPSPPTVARSAVTPLVATDEAVPVVVELLTSLDGDIACNRFANSILHSAVMSHVFS